MMFKKYSLLILLVIIFSLLPEFVIGGCRYPTNCEQIGGTCKEDVSNHCSNPDHCKCDEPENDPDPLPVCTKYTYYLDADSDGYYPISGIKYQCDSPGSDWTRNIKNPDDCNDGDQNIKPGAIEICDNINNNCDSETDEGCDDDGDGFCDINMEYVEGLANCQFGNGDCNDEKNSINPNIVEICNGIDDNCNSQIDEGCDSDQDGFIDISLECENTPKCTDDSGLSESSTCNGCTSMDCNDELDSINPDAEEECNGVDDNCDGDTDDFTIITHCGVGACSENTGEQICTGGSLGINTCNKFEGASTNDDTCDNIDDDCDGEYNEDYKEPTTCGQGACAATGFEYCGIGGIITNTCTIVVQPTNEICNGIDDDCDGINDNNPIDCLMDQYCSGENGCKDYCGDGIIQDFEGCDDGKNGDDTDGCLDDCSLISCGDNEINHATEDCDDGKNGNNTDLCTDRCKFTFCLDGVVQKRNGKDNFMEVCDIEVRNCDWLGSIGTQSCLSDCSGYTECIPINNPTDFIEENEEENQENNVNLVLPSSCTDGSPVDCQLQGGVCFGYFSECSSGISNCDYYSYSGKYQPEEIDCDGFDNDCDGQIDENCGCGKGSQYDCQLKGGVCEGYFESCSGSGTIPICSFYSYNKNYEKIEYSCDELDNDCDGIIDEGCVCESGISRSCINLECGNGEQECVNEKWSDCNCKSIEEKVQITKDDVDTIISLIETSEYTKKVTDINNINDNMERSLDNSDIILKTESKDGKTLVTHTIGFDKSQKNTKVYLKIPKCLSEKLDIIKFNNQKYEIIQEDPLIAWHFSKSSDKIDLSYEIEGEFSEDCLRLIKALPIASEILDKKEKTIWSYIFPILIVPIIVGVILYAKKNNREITPTSEKQDQEKIIENFISSQVRRIKSDNRFKTAEHVRGELEGLNMSDEMIDEINKRLGF